MIQISPFLTQYTKVQPSDRSHTKSHSILSNYRIAPTHLMFMTSNRCFSVGPISLSFRHNRNRFNCLWADTNLWNILDTTLQYDPSTTMSIKTYQCQEILSLHCNRSSLDFVEVLLRQLDTSCKSSQHSCFRSLFQVSMTQDTMRRFQHVRQ